MQNQDWRDAVYAFSIAQSNDSPVPVPLMTTYSDTYDTKPKGTTMAFNPPLLRTFTNISLGVPDTAQDLVDEKKYHLSHINWFKRLKLNAPPEKLVKRLQRAKDWFNELGDLVQLPLVYIGHCFYQYYLEYLNERMEDALTTLDRIDNVIEEFREDIGEDTRHLLKYILLCEKATFSFLLNRLDIANRYLTKLKSTNLPHPVSSKPMILFLMGQFAGKFAKKEMRIHLFREAIELDPLSSTTYISLSRALRSFRREYCWGSPPTDEEVSTCLNGINIVGDQSAVSCLILTTLFEEVVRYKYCHYSSVEALGLTSETLPKWLQEKARKAAELAPNCLASQVKYADIFSSGGHDELLEAEQQYQLCMKKWPNSSQVFHKAGKFFAEKRTLELGLELLTLGLAFDRENFPCMMDFLRHKSRSKESDVWKSVLTELENSIINFGDQRPAFVHKLLNAQGAVLWHIGEKNAAVDSWINAFGIGKGQMNSKGYKLQRDIRGWPIFKFEFDAKDILLAVQELKRSETGQHTSHINQFIEALSSNQNPPRPRAESYRDSIADSDSNWRSGSNVSSSSYPSSELSALVTESSSVGQSRHSQFPFRPLNPPIYSGRSGRDSSVYSKQRHEPDPALPSSSKYIPPKRRQQQCDMDDNWRK